MELVKHVYIIKTTNVLIYVYIDTFNSNDFMIINPANQKKSFVNVNNSNIIYFMLVKLPYLEK